MTDRAVITSFGYLHDPPPEADIIVDVRQHLRDPHVDPEFRKLDARDWRVQHRVVSTPGVSGLTYGLANSVIALMEAAWGTNRIVTMAIGCAGGRHRSAVLVDTIGEILRTAGWLVKVEHRDLLKPVVERSE